MSTLSPALSYTRYSSPRQAFGHSETRQIDLARDYCETNKLQFVEVFDRGLSGFHGEHRKRGALGRLLEDLRAGHIKKGTKLIVESLDRLSRETAFEHLGLALDVIRAGIELVVLRGDGTADIYSSETLRREPHRMHVLIAEMQRAHDESSIKSRRGLGNWKSTSKKIQKGEPVPGRHPGWIVFQDGDFTFHFERKAAVEQMIEHRFDGHGLTKICRFLNDNKVPTWQANGSGKWQDSMVKRILRHPALYGEYRFSRPVEGVTPDPVEDYYPAIVSRGDWLRLQKIIDGARKTGGGRTTRLVPNLFRGLLYCRCGHKMQIFGNSEQAKYHKRYYYCKNARASSDCSNKQFWPFEDLENRVLFAIANELAEKLPTIKDDQKDFVRLEELRSELLVQEDKLEKAEARLLEADDVVFEALKRQMTKAKAHSTELLAEIDTLEAEIANRSESSIMERIERVGNLISKRGDDKARIELRRLVSCIIERIDVQDCSSEWGSAAIQILNHQVLLVVQRKDPEVSF